MKMLDYVSGKLIMVAIACSFAAKHTHSAAQIELCLGPF
jgi:hypothetical protein